jgi:transcriptional regulator with XRE-family HTH domain
VDAVESYRNALNRIGERLRIVRERKGLNMTIALEIRDRYRVAIDPSYMSRMERGKAEIPLRTLVAFASLPTRRSVSCWPSSPVAWDRSGRAASWKRCLWNCWIWPAKNRPAYANPGLRVKKPPPGKSRQSPGSQGKARRAAQMLDPTRRGRLSTVVPGRRLRRRLGFPCN